jgi:hypothetical protein
VKREVLFHAWNETTHALLFAKSAATRFAANGIELESGSKTAVSIAYIKNRLFEAQDSLLAQKKRSAVSSRAPTLRSFIHSCSVTKP